MAAREQPNHLPPHVVVFPLPAQGHLNSMLNLAHLLCLSNFHVTFIVSDFSHRRLATVDSIFAAYPGFQFQPIPDGQPDDHPRAGKKVMDIFPAVNETMAPLFKKWMIQEGFFASADRRRVTCIIADGILGFAADFAAEAEIPLVCFRTPSAACLWTFFRLNELIQAGEVPVTGNDMDELVKDLPGMGGLLRRRDLPSFCRVDDAYNPMLQVMATATQQTVRAQAVIFNTFEDLEAPAASKIRNYIPRTYTIGPIHAHLKSRLKEKNIQATTLSGGFWLEDTNCIDWLNAQAPKSVIYISFGSVAVVTRQQLSELWHGLVNSRQKFLWVMRPDSISEEDGLTGIPDEVMEGCKKQGYVVDWAPQEEVLNHPAVGAFLTHSGWNSTLESIVAGVPMICWPYFGDQMVNSRFVSEVWKIGLDIKDTCDRLIVENAVREVMEIRKDEFQEKADCMSQLARKAVCPGGSSYSNWESFIDYINSLIV